jgi:hypothetical protein
MFFKKRSDGAGWKALAASARGLSYVPGNPPYQEPAVMGRYQRCRVELHTTANITFLDVVALWPVEVPRLSPGRPVVVEDIASGLLYVNPASLKGLLTVEPNGQAFHYEQYGVEEDGQYLKALIDLLVQLVQIYPKILALGGEAVLLLQTVTAIKDYVLQPVARRWLANIEQETTARLGPHADNLVCPRCLVRCAAHTVPLSPLQSLTFYGCRACRHSQELINVRGRLVAVLNQQMKPKQARRDEDLLVNWLARRSLFDFDRIEIVKADDEAVERFAIQAGNHADELQQSHYKQVSCLISAGCSLSANTLRILRGMFGQVEVAGEIG